MPQHDSCCLGGGIGLQKVDQVLFLLVLFPITSKTINRFPASGWLLFGVIVSNFFASKCFYIIGDIGLFEHRMERDCGQVISGFSDSTAGTTGVDIAFAYFLFDKFFKRSLGFLGVVELFSFGLSVGASSAIVDGVTVALKDNVPELA